VGATVTIKVGLKNHGPAAIREGRAGDPTYSADVVFPKGVTTTAVPQDCLPVVNGTIDGDDQGKPGFGAYDCMAYQKVGVGDTVLISFSLRIDKALTDAKGSIVVGQPTAGDSADGWDHHLANNTADIVINPSGDSGSLPVTGSNAFAIAAVGALVVAAGVMLVWFGRRRRRVA
jgi:LPXTG-motif cell wall-anchored protein